MLFSLASVAALDLSGDGEIIDGKRTYLVRSRIPFAFSATLTEVRVENRKDDKKKVECVDCADGSCSGCKARDALPKIDNDGEGATDPTNPGEQEIKKSADESVEVEGTRPADMMKGPKLYGIASSTGVDTYGTEMSRKALDGMAAQFNGGEVCYLPQHPAWSGQGGEWDSIIGYVAKAEVVSSAVENAANTSELGFAVRVEVNLDDEMPKALELAKAMKRKMKIGQSIGGWFTELRYIYAEGADKWDPPERVIIEGVDLDHLAATRRPSNGDSWIDGMRSAIASAHEQAVVRAKSLAVPAPIPVVRVDTEIVPETTMGTRNNTVALDTGAAPRHDSPDDAGSEGHRASPGATESGLTPSTPTEELKMTAEELRALLAEQLAPVVARLDAVEAKTAVAPPPGTRAADPAPAAVAGETDEVKALKARLAAAEGRQADKYLSNRKGHAGLGTFDRGVIQAVGDQHSEEAPNLAAVARHAKFLDRRSVDHFSATFDEQSNMRANLESDLNALINSATDDGVIREPDNEVGSWA